MAEQLGYSFLTGAPSTSVHCDRALHQNHLLQNTEITNVPIVFENRMVSSQPEAIAGCDTLLKRNIYTIPIIKHSNLLRDFFIQCCEVHDRNAHWLQVPL